MDIQQVIEANRDNIVIYGPRCIGKSHFASHNMTWFDMTDQNDLDHYKQIMKSFGYPSSHFFSKNNSNKDIKIIILGAPFFIWKERIEHRKTLCQPQSLRSNQRRMRRLNYLAEFTVDMYKDSYVKSIRNLDELNFSYILVDNRNSYPILDELNFFKMLTDQTIKEHPLDKGRTVEKTSLNN